MFNYRFNTLMNELNATLISLAECSGLDRSNISRFRSGARIPKSTGSTALKLADGFYTLALQNDTISILCKIINCDENESSKEIKQSILTYLFEETSKENSSDNSKVAYAHFADRLDLIMRQIPISNSELSNLLHIDASLISRYRNGERNPSNKGPSNIASALVDMLYERILNSNSLEIIAKHINIDINEFDKDAFAFWLLKTNEERTNIAFVENLLKQYDSYDKQSGYALPTYEDIFANEKIDDGPSIYYGISGLQSAVIRFLRNVIESGDNKELLLYSDFNQDWITRDKSFQTKWIILMNECVKKGIRIKIIHNINRDFDEMKKAIQSWLPLYMSGMVESYYFKKQMVPRFNHTIFLCPGYDAISGFCARNTNNDEVIFNYYTNKKSLDCCMTSYHKMMMECNPIIQSYTSYDFEKNNAIILDGNPFTNIAIYIFSDQILFYSKKNPDLIFRFSHPLLCRAFNEYAKTIQ